MSPDMGHGPDPRSPQFGAIHVRCLFTPCHTSGHMCYFMWEDGSPDAPALFSGTPTLLPCTPSPPHAPGANLPHPSVRLRVWGPPLCPAPCHPAGDTLFVGGCGKFFEGTAEQMYTNLTQVLGALPKETVSTLHLPPCLGG